MGQEKKTIMKENHHSSLDSTNLARLLKAHGIRPEGGCPFSQTAPGQVAARQTQPWHRDRHSAEAAEVEAGRLPDRRGPGSRRDGA